MVFRDYWSRARNKTAFAKLTALSLCVSACLIVATRNAAADEASKHLDLARQFNENGQGSAALAEANRAIALKPRYPEALVARGWLFLQFDKPDLAMKDFNIALQVNPKYYEGYVSKAYVFRIMKKPDESRTETDKALKLDPNRPEAPYMHGLSCLVEGYTNQAIRDFTKAITIGSKHPLLSYAYYWRGRAYEMNKDYGLAISDFSKAIKFESQLKSKGYVRNYGPFSDPRVLANDDQRRNSLGVLERGLCYSKIGEYQKAIDDFTLVIKSNPTETLMLEERGNAYLKLGKYRLALQDFNKSILKGSPSSKLYLYLAIAHYSLAAFDKTINDVDAWLGRTFWNDDQTVFAVFLKYSALNKLSKKAEGRSLIDTALVKLKKDKAWPYPALELATGRISPEKCLASVAKSGKRQQTEARLYVALSAQVAGNVASARENFYWVVKNGDRTTDEFTVANTEIGRKTSP